MRPERLAGDGDHREDEDEEPDQLDLGRKPVDRGITVSVEDVGVCGRAQTLEVLFLRITTNSPTIEAPTPNVISTPTRPATRVPVDSDSTPLTP